MDSQTQPGLATYPDGRGVRPKHLNRYPENLPADRVLAARVLRPDMKRPVKEGTEGTLWAVVCKADHNHQGGESCYGPRKAYVKFRGHGFGLVVPLDGLELVGRGA